MSLVGCASHTALAPVSTTKQPHGYIMTAEEFHNLEIDGEYNLEAIRSRPAPSPEPNDKFVMHLLKIKLENDKVKIQKD